MKNKKIIFVCTGNTCRSVMAEFLFKKMISDEIRENPQNKNPLADFDITSAGIAPIPGMNIAPGTVKALREEKARAEGHRASKLTAEQVREAGLVLVMEERQRKEASRIAGGCCENKILLLGGLKGGEKKDISDPFGNSAEIYMECMAEIKKGLKELLKKLLSGEIKIPAP